MLKLDALMSSLDISPTLKQVTEAYSQKLIGTHFETEKHTLGTAFSTPRSVSRPRSAALSDARPSYSSVDRTRQMRPAKKDSKELYEWKVSSNVKKQTDTVKMSSDLKSVSSLSIASLTFFDDLDPEKHQTTTLESARWNEPDKRSMKSPTRSSAKRVHSGVLRKQAKLGTTWGCSTRSEAVQRGGEKKSEGNDEGSERTKKLVTTITFGSKDTGLENGFIIQKGAVRSEQTGKERPDAKMGSRKAPKSAEPRVTHLHTEKLSLNSDVYVDKGTASSRANFPSRNYNQLNPHKNRVKSAPSAVGGDRTVVKVQYNLVTLFKY